jgi:hypothetical protein
MRISRYLGLGTLFSLILALSARADDLLPPSKPIEEAIDYYIDAGLKQAGVRAAPAADDANLLRRLTLDLVGRISTVAETKAFVSAAEPAKRVQLVDRLMASPGFVRHQATEFDTLLMNGKGSLRDYLTRAFTEKRGWDGMFRDLLLASDGDPKQQNASQFLKQRLTDLDKLTNDVSVAFFGVNISCAKCHDHPKVPDWKQDHFYGMKSFFSRTFDNGGFVAEREFGLVKFKTVAGQERQAKFMFLTGKSVDMAGTKEPNKDEEKKEKERFEALKKSKTPPPLPKVSARAQLVDLALAPGQRDFFSRAIVNRVWHRLVGHGLVMPLDQMHSENPPSHPELLQWLARDLDEHHYDLRRLIRGVVLSKAYARSSRWPGSDVPRPSLLAVANVRALTPMQLCTSLRIATADPATLAGDQKPEELEKRLEAHENSARGLAALIEQPGENFQISVSEALLFSNGARMMNELLVDGNDRLLGRLKQIKDEKELIDMMVRATLSRPASDEEVKSLGDYLKRRADRREEACRQIAWALLTGSEFRFNY